jgi:hypothetical protein
MNQLASLYDILLKEESICNYERCVEIYREIKIILIRNGILLERVDIETTRFVREVLETMARISIYRRDMNMFDRIMMLLHFYHHDLIELSPSDNTYPLISIKLLKYLVLDEHSKFHVFLEELPIEVLNSNTPIIYPIRLEQCLMEGNLREAERCITEYKNSLNLVNMIENVYCGTSSDLLSKMCNKSWLSEDYQGLKSQTGPTKLSIDLLIDRNLYFSQELERIV